MKLYPQYLLLLIGHLSLVNVRPTGLRMVLLVSAVLTGSHRRAVTPTRFDGLAMGSKQGMATGKAGEVLEDFWGSWERWREARERTRARVKAPQQKRSPRR
jgi:hypothetical protein